MAADLQRLIELVQSRDPSFILRVSSEWGSDASDYRLRLREDIADHLSDPSALDLGSRPHPLTHSVSISHTKGMGGWCGANRPLLVGFDVEQSARLTPSAVQRISSPNEFNQAPDFRLLWVAKESSFKALEMDQPDVVSQIKIGHWKPLDANLFYFDLGNGPRSYGFSLILNAYIYSVCLRINVSN